MDATVIEEIANQLGMAVDTAGQFVADILPKYATMQVIESMGFVVGALLFVIVAWGVLCKVNKWSQQQIENTKDKPYSERFDKEVYQFVTTIATVTVGIIAIVLIPFCIASAVDAIAWAVCPEAKLLDLALVKVA
jgi:Ca2+/Na+ antiporter